MFLTDSDIGSLYARWFSHPATISLELVLEGRIVVVHDSDRHSHYLPGAVFGSQTGRKWYPSEMTDNTKPIVASPIRRECT